MLKSFKYRIYPDPTQATLIQKHFGCCRWVYNWGLQKTKEIYETEKRRVTKYELGYLLPGLKKHSDTLWLKEVTAQSLESSLANLSEAYRRFFTKISNYPKFKSKKSKQSYCVRQDCLIDFENKVVHVPKIRNIKVVVDREFIGKIKTSTISQSASGRYFISFAVDDGETEPQKPSFTSDGCVGVDLGLKHFVILSNGEKIDNPKYFEKLEKKMAREQRRLSRKKKGSKKRQKQRTKVAEVYEKIVNQRNDFLHKLSTRLVCENQAIALEDLNVKGMLKNKNLAKSISSVAWSEFVRQLEYKALWRGKTILRIGRFEPSSKMCSCGVINKDLKLSDREWVCAVCGELHDRDILAANNIKRFALRQGMPEFTPEEIGAVRSVVESGNLILR